VTSDLFDDKARALRRTRALSRGSDLFLYERAFDEVMERLALVQRSFSNALLIGCVQVDWRERVRERASVVDVIDPKELMQLEPGSYDLCLSVGVLDTADDLPSSLLAMRFALKADSLALGALSGGDTLPVLRSAMRAADQVMGAASPRVHPRIEPSALAQLLSDAGFIMPVVDVDRVNVSYRRLGDLVEDLRAMGATNILSARPRHSLTRAAADAAARQFASRGRDGRVIERFELLHFAAWAPPGLNG
jgi:NADH dehydrogenase [ubiquinone] 1 alpha subcomplex assembly factor 5